MRAGLPLLLALSAAVHPEVATLRLPGVSMTRVADAARTGLPDRFWCPMHPDERAGVPGRCGLCGMALVVMPPARFTTYPVDLRVTPTLGGVRLRLAVSDPDTRAIVRAFTVVHERPLHLFVIGGGLEFFTHDHPVQQTDGVFMLDVTLPRQGPYMAIAEFLPEGGTPQLFQQAFTTGEAFARPAHPALDLGAKMVDGVRVTLDGAQAAAGEPTRLAFSIAHADGTPVTDLEPYLGASAHLLVVPVDLTEAIHGHPTEEVAGPGVSFAPLFPRAGRYKAWVQFQRAGRVTTAAFVFDVAGTRAGGVGPPG